MHEDICLEFLALSEVRWSLYGMVMFICDRAFLCIPSQRSSNTFLTTQYIYIAYISEAMLLIWAIGKNGYERQTERGRKVKEFEKKFLI